MAKVLYFNTETEAEFKNVKVKDGEITIGDKTFDPDQSIPINLKTRFGVRPLYFLKWDCIRPGEVQNNVLDRREEFDGLKNAIANKDVDWHPFGKNIISTVVFTRDSKNIPESLYKTQRLKILGGMLKVKRGAAGAGALILGLIIGVIMTFMLFYFKMIKI